VSARVRLSLSIDLVDPREDADDGDVPWIHPYGDQTPYEVPNNAIPTLFLGLPHQRSAHLDVEEVELARVETHDIGRSDDDEGGEEGDEEWADRVWVLSSKIEDQEACR